MNYTITEDKRGHKTLTILKIDDPGRPYHNQKLEIKFCGTWTGGDSDKVMIRYGKRKDFTGLHWGPHNQRAWVQSLYNAKGYADVGLNVAELKHIFKEIGAVNELESFNRAVTAWEYPEGENRLQPAPDKEEIKTAITEAIPDSMDLNLTGTIFISDYSEKAIVVTGNTKPIKETLKGLGGKFNAHLKTGPGWIFAKTREQKVREALI